MQQTGVAGGLGEEARCLQHREKMAASLPIDNKMRTSLVVQRLRIHLPGRDTGLHPWSWKIHRAAKPIITAAEPELSSLGAQLLKPTCLRAVFSTREASATRSPPRMPSAATAT